MIYLIGGPGRAGKTTLAWRLLKGHGIPFFSLDYLMMGVHHGAPSLGVDPNEREAIVAPRLWPVCKPMIVAMLENGEHYCVEGFAITPEYASQLMALFPSDVRVCFLGYCVAGAETKWREELQYPSTNAWSPDLSQEKVAEEFALRKETSIALQQECTQRGFAFFDTSARFEEVVALAETYLTTTP